MNAPSNHLYTLVRIGTSRAPGARLEGLPGAFGAILPAFDDSAERQAWQALGALSLWTRAGRQPLAAAPAPLPAAAEMLHPCPARAEALLARLLKSRQDPKLLGEWLGRLRHAGGRLPARMLPDLLALATRQAALRDSLMPVLGERGRWLAALEAEWQWAIAAATPQERQDLWETGTPEQRRAALASMRIQDPALARDALAQVWTTETPEQRTQLLSCLAAGLGPDDEPFLEAALDDRRKEVRSLAQVLLTRLPHSNFVQRMRARAEPLLTLKRPLLGRASIEVALPDAIDKTWKRDGIGAGAHPGLGEKAGWVADLLAAIDPHAWSARFGMTPADCLQAAEHSEFNGAIVRGWATATLRNAHARLDASDWIDALLMFWVTAAHPLHQQFPNDFFDIFGCMPGAGLHALLPRLLADGAAREQEARWFTLFTHAAQRSTAEWPAALSHAIVTRLLHEWSGAGRSSWHLREAFDALAHVVAPSTVLALEAGWRAQAGDHTGDGRIDAFFDTVRLRHELSLSFQEPA